MLKWNSLEDTHHVYRPSMKIHLGLQTKKAPTIQSWKWQQKSTQMELPKKHGTTCCLLMTTSGSCRDKRKELKGKFSTRVSCRQHKHLQYYQFTYLYQLQLVLLSYVVLYTLHDCFCIVIRFGRVGVKPPAIEVRYEKLCVEAESRYSSGATHLPSLWNSVKGAYSVRQNIWFTNQIQYQRILTNTLTFCFISLWKIHFQTMVARNHVAEIIILQNHKSYPCISFSH